MANLQTIKNRWQAAQKVSGLQSVLTLANGRRVTGQYVLTTSGAFTASHDALNGFCQSAGFPTDVNGGSVNDRDYWRDTDAQRITRDIARNYDGRALQSPVIVSRDGVVISGNGRTMAGELAAHDGTDTAYISELSQYPGRFGFTSEQVATFLHPRVVFLLDDEIPYNATTFAAFNAQEMKSQNKTEQAIKFGKLVSDSVFSRILATLNGFDTLADFYACTEAATRCINELLAAGVLSEMQRAEMYDGDTISAGGREILENVLIGKAFAADPDAARKITSYKSIRKIIVTALGEISNNLVLCTDYSLGEELTAAIGLAYQARKEGDYKEGERVSEFARQSTIFGGTVANYGNAVVLLLSDMLNSTKTTQLKKVFAVYNHQAQDASNGQIDMFSAGGVKTKDEILSEVKAIFATGDRKEQKAAVTAAVEQRKSDNLFVTDEQLTRVVAGSFVEYRTKSGDVITCKVESVCNMTAQLIAKGGIKFRSNVLSLTPTASHSLTFPAWLAAGRVITDGVTSSQRILAVTESHVIFEWINGGYYEAHLTTVLQKFWPTGEDVCEIIEAA